MDSENPTVRGSRAGNVAIAVTIALTALWSTSAFSRAQVDADCDEFGHELRNLDAPVQRLQISVVDHAIPGADMADAEAVERESAARDSATPQLYLSPRIASHLRDMFDDAGTPQEAVVDVPASPIAEREEIREARKPVDEAAEESADAEDIHAPLLERQMYRIDI